MTASYSRAPTSSSTSRWPHATGNALMAWLYRQINEVRGHDQWNEMKRKILTPENIDLYNAQHRELYGAIRRRDVDAAVRCIDEHLDKARRDLLGADVRPGPR